MKVTEEVVRPHREFFSAFIRSSFWCIGAIALVLIVLALTLVR